MTKLLYCQQELNKPIPRNYSKKLRDSVKKMKKSDQQLIKLLITCKQCLNCHWIWIAVLIVSSCSVIDIGHRFGWISRNSTYISVLHAFLGFSIGVIITGFFVGGDDKKFIAGAAAVGTAIGLLTGASTFAQTGAAVGTMFGPAGVIVGGLAVGLIGGGMAAVYRYR